jgi:DNA polymerase-3 subunit delta'
VIRPEGGEITIDRVREIQRDISYYPLEGGKKVYILEDSESMNVQTANAFLKALEEPPPRVLFILLAERIHTMLPTLLSRCRKMAIPPAPEKREAGSEAPGSSSDLLDRCFNAGREGLSAVFEFSEKTGKQEGGLEALLSQLEIHLRDGLVLRATGNAGLLLNPPGRVRPGSSNAGEIEDLLEKVRSIQKGLERNVNRRLALETLLIRMKIHQERSGESLP